MILSGLRADLTSLRSFSEAFFGALDAHFQERDSANYINETYFCGSKDGLRFSVWAPNGDNLQHGHFLIEVSAHNSGSQELMLKLTSLKENCFEFWQVNHFGKEMQSFMKL